MNSESSNIALFGGRRFNSYAAYFRRQFGGRMQKVAINAGFSCPNRDGSRGVGGCTFCNNSAFTPSYCEPHLSVTKQIDEGILFHRNRYKKAVRYLAYFQSFSNTYAPLEQLKKLYDEALSHPDVAGVIIGTRPDCVDEQKLDYFAELAAREGKYIAIEYGIESCYDSTLKSINRGHSFADARWAVEQTAKRGIHVGAHFILGLPGETEQMLREQISVINELPLSTIKFHQLQIFKDTQMAADYDASPESFSWWTVEEYISLFIDLLEHLRPDIVMERFASEAPPRYHHGPNWGLVRNETLLATFERELERRNTYQGRCYGK
ncbi:MAG: TIGR01212 family radical SAM protein [Rikenellaceae bacterium]